MKQTHTDYRETTLEAYPFGHARAQEAFASACVSHPHWRVRLVSMECLTQQALLAYVAKHAADYEVFKGAIEKIHDDTLLEDVALYPCKDRHSCVLAIQRIGNENMLFQIAQTHPYAEIRKTAVACITSQGFLLAVAEGNSDAVVREEAIGRLDNPECLERIAFRDPNDAVKRKAISMIADPARLLTLVLESESMAIKKFALHRMYLLHNETGLDPVLAAQLNPCLESALLIANAISLMDISGVAWWKECTQATIPHLYQALSTSGLYREVKILEKAVVSLYTNRTDLRQELLADMPLSFPEQTPDEPLVWRMLTSEYQAMQNLATNMFPARKADR